MKYLFDIYERTEKQIVIEVEADNQDEAEEKAEANYLADKYRKELDEAEDSTTDGFEIISINNN